MSRNLNESSPAAAAAWEKFLDWARHRGWSQETIAFECTASRAHLNQVLTGSRTGGHTWRRIVRCLPMDGLLLLQHCAAWNKFADKAFAQRVESERQAKVLQDLAARCREEACP